MPRPDDMHEDEGVWDYRARKRYEAALSAVERIERGEGALQREEVASALRAIFEFAKGERRS